MSASQQALLMTGGGGGGGLPSLDLVFIDGSEHWATAVDKFKNSAFGSHSAPASGVDGAHGKVADDATWDWHGVTFTGVSTITTRGRFRFRVIGTAEDFLSLMNGATTHLQVALRTDGTIQVQPGGGGFTHITTSVYAIDTWYDIELTATIHDSTGSYTLTIDGTVPAKSGGGTMTGSGLDTKNGSTSTVDKVAFGGGNSIDTYVDDHAIDASGNEIDAGEVETLYPDGAGDLAEMTRGGSDSGANWSQCDEATGNGTTDYVQSTGSNQSDTYTFQSRSISGTPRAVQVTTYVAAASGSPTFKNRLRISGVNYDGAITHTAVSGFDCYTELWNIDPSSAAAWVDAIINGFQAGILAIDSDVRMTQVVVEVWVTT